MRWEYDDVVESFLVSFIARALPDVTTFTGDYTNDFSILATEGVGEGEPTYVIALEVPTDSGPVALDFTLSITGAGPSEMAEVSEMSCVRYGEGRGRYVWTGEEWVPADDGPEDPDDGPDDPDQGPVRFRVY